ncbi:Ala-tRNA(Pro) hydrolase [Aureimonas ureilytica]|uniref:Ala-tRNA(Pro) hydrolase n=1 Tax=Aureimonas ureilytica TaxID=401562 RepID=A0A175REZ8_9HYPH|nr:alanyl-tRNA editing protein [Aureimonas ureilytica]KTR02380.1 Ala-tRNA(Pro) hydrolase [Aureimonas ureilytica]
MSGETDAVYSEDSYLSTMEARLLRIEGTAGLVFDRSNFFPAGGGQPGDRGFIERADGTQLLVVDTRYNEDRSAILLVLDETSPLPEPGETLILHVDWARRYRMMRMHTALHLLTVVCPYPVTGAAVGEDDGRIDFDLPEADTDKTEVTRQLMELVRANHPVSIRWITDAELDANPSLLKSAHVRPPRGSGRVRLVVIGAEGEVDSQPCGGTHVSETQEIGDIHIAKIEKKGKTNRRFRVRFGEASLA